MAVLLMVACPLAALVGSDGGSSGASVKTTQNATHIKLTDLDQDDLYDLFYEFDPYYPETNMSGLITLDLSSLRDLLGFIAPGFNFIGAAGFDTDKFVMSGVDIEFDIVRTVEYGKEVNMVVGISVDIDKYSMTFDRTFEGMFMLASDAYDVMSMTEMSWHVPEAYNAFLMKSEEEFVQKVVTFDGSPIAIERAMYEMYKADVKNNLGDEADPKSQESMEAMVAAYVESDKYAYADTLASYTKLQQLLGNGEYGDAIRDAYQLEVFDGSPVTISGSAHFELYIESDLKTEYLFKNDGLNYYAVSESGLSTAIAEGALGLVFNDNFINSLRGGKFLELMACSPLSEMDLRLDSDMKVSHADSEIDFSTSLLIGEKSVIGFEYEGPDYIDPSWNEGQGTNYKMHVKDMELKIQQDSTVTVGGKSFSNNGLDLDLSGLLRQIFDGMQGSTYTKGGLIDCKMMYIAVDEDGVETSGLGYFAVFEIYYDEFLMAFHSIILNNDSLSADEAGTYESQAKSLIRSVDGYCSHDILDAQNGAESIRDSILSGEPKDNSMLILGIVVVVIAVLAVIAFALIIRNSRY